MEHNSIILFSTASNHKHLHKIILEHQNKNDNLDKTRNSDNRWLGITFRLSKIFIKFKNKIPYIQSTNNILRIATDLERKEFYKHKGTENSSNEYKYPEIDYTISKNDLMSIL